jgi:hypothetical protein
MKLKSLGNKMWEGGKKLGNAGRNFTKSIMGMIKKKKKKGKKGKNLEPAK